MKQFLLSTIPADIDLHTTFILLDGRTAKVFLIGQRQGGARPVYFIETKVSTGEFVQYRLTDNAWLPVHMAWDADAFSDGVKRYTKQLRSLTYSGSGTWNPTKYGLMTSAHYPAGGLQDPNNTVQKTAHTNMPNEEWEGEQKQVEKEQVLVPDTLITVEVKCECGADKIGSGSHSYWCPKVL